MNVMEKYKELGEGLTPREELVREVAEAAMVSPETARAWVRGSRIPPLNRRVLMAQHFGCEPEDLGFEDK